MTTGELAQRMARLPADKRALLELRLRRRRDRERTAPLTWSQERLWRFERLHPGTSVYNLPHALRIGGELGISALEASLAELVRRHEALRVTFEETPDGPVQRVRGGRPARLPVVDLTGLPPRPRQRAADELVRREARRPLDLSEGPPLRTTILRLASDTHHLLLTVHHLVADGWTLGVMTRELTALYRAYGNGAASPLDAPPVQYLEVARWQHRRRERDVFRDALERCRRRLADPPPLLDLPADRPRPAVATPRGVTVSTLLPRTVVADLVALGREAEATLFMVFLAVWTAWLHRCTGRQDLTVGSPVANRWRPELERVVGLFLHTVVIRERVTGDRSFRRHLDALREAALEALGDAEVPQDALAPGGAPAFQTMLVLQNLPRRPGRLGSADLEPLAADHATAKFDLTLAAHEEEHGHRLTLEARRDLFDPATVRRMLGHVLVLATAAAADPAERLDALPLLTAPERHQLLHEWAEAAGPVPPPATTPEAIREVAARGPDRIALDFPHVQLTYGELMRCSRRIAAALRRRGAGPETVVALALGRTPEAVAARLGAWETGAAYLPLDPEHPAERLRDLLHRARPDLVLTAGDGDPDLIPDGIPRLDLSRVSDPADGDGESESPDPRRLAYVVYTSGSTGVPKGVEVAHGGLRNLVEVQARQLAPEAGDRVLQLFSLAFDASLWDVLLALASGGRLVVAAGKARRPGPALERLLREREVTLVTFPPSLLAAMEPEGYPALATVVTTGEACSSEVVERWAPGRRFFNGYGPTETTVGATLGICRPRPRAPALGSPFLNLTVRVLDGRFRPVPMGAAGEIVVGGAGVARGYRHAAAATAESFAPDPWGPPGSRLYRTGDLGRFRPDGELDFLGRADEQVQVRGFRVEPREVEVALTASSGVADAAVLSHDGPGGPTLTAFVAPREVSVAEIRRRLRSVLPAYMVPARFVSLDRLPRTVDGKLDRAALPAPDLPSLPDEASPQPPRGAAERALVAVWADVLGRPRVGVEDDFFDLGGDSILALRIATRARDAGWVVTPAQVFEHSTVADLARAADPVTADPATDRPEAVEPGEEIPLTPIQSWFFTQGFRSPGHWNQALMLEPDDAVRAAGLGVALDAVARRHPALALRFRPGDDRRRRQIQGAPDDAWPWARVDLSRLPSDASRRALEALAATVESRLDVAEGPLARAVLFDRGADGRRLLLVVHHLAVDTVSWGILLEDLIAATSGGPVRPELTPFPRWAALLEREAHDPETIRQADLWCGPAWERARPLPEDGAGGDDLEATAATVSGTLSPEATQGLLHDLPRAYQAGVEDAILTALEHALEGWADGPAVVDLERHGRNRSDLDLSRTVGWLTTFHPVLLEPERPGDLAARLKAVKELLRSVPGQGRSYLLLRHLGPPEIARRLAGTPDASLVVNYLGHAERATLSGPAAWRLASEDVGPLHAPDERRTHALELRCRVAQGRLHAGWSYHEARHQRGTVDALARRFLDALEEIAAHCRAPEAGGMTPSDLEDVDLSQDELDDLLDDLAWEDA